MRFALAESPVVDEKYRGDAGVSPRVPVVGFSFKSATNGDDKGDDSAVTVLMYGFDKDILEDDACLNVRPSCSQAGTPTSETAVVEDEASVAEPDSDAYESTLSNGGTGGASLLAMAVSFDLKWFRVEESAGGAGESGRRFSFLSLKDARSDDDGSF